MVDVTVMETTSTPLKSVTPCVVIMLKRRRRRPHRPKIRSSCVPFQLMMVDAVPRSPCTTSTRNPMPVRNSCTVAAGGMIIDSTRKNPVMNFANQSCSSSWIAHGFIHTSLTPVASLPKKHKPSHPCPCSATAAVASLIHSLLSDPRSTMSCQTHTHTHMHTQPKCFIQHTK